VDNEWQWEQEIRYLQGGSDTGIRKIFTNQELKFIRENNLNYGRVYALVHRRYSAKDALIETLEGIL